MMILFTRSHRPVPLWTEEENIPDAFYYPEKLAILSSGTVLYDERVYNNFCKHRASKCMT